MTQLARNTGVIACCHALHEKAPIVWVSHDHDGEYSIACTGRHRSETELSIVCANTFGEEIFQLLDGLDFGQVARRSALDQPWTIEALPPDDEDEDLDHADADQAGATC